MKRVRKWWRRLLRDFFAGCAMTGIMANLLAGAGEIDIPFRRCSEVAYRIADAMLKAREAK